MFDQDLQGPNFEPRARNAVGCGSVNLNWTVLIPEKFAKSIDDNGEAILRRSFTIDRAQEFVDMLQAQLDAIRVE